MYLNLFHPYHSFNMIRMPRGSGYWIRIKKQIHFNRIVVIIGKNMKWMDASKAGIVRICPGLAGGAYNSSIVI
jgi:hypothetical protein